MIELLLLRFSTIASFFVDDDDDAMAFGRCPSSVELNISMFRLSVFESNQATVGDVPRASSVSWLFQVRNRRSDCMLFDAMLLDRPPEFHFELKALNTAFDFHQAQIMYYADTGLIGIVRF